MEAKPLRLLRASSGRNCKRFIHTAVLCCCALFTAGCNSITQDSPTTREFSHTAHPVISLQSALPSPTVGQAYDSAISVSGGTAPYYFSISAGQLPQGLSLNSTTGSIAGTPTQASQSAFTIAVRGSDDSSGARTYTIAVGARNSSVAVQISPLNPSITPGAKIRFVADVLNTSNTAVSWSASAGSITSAGLFTAPANLPNTPIVVTVTSVAQSSAQASTTLAVATSNLSIVNSTLPSGTVGTPYSAQFTATGGQPTYLWSISSGSLPLGLQLGSSTGAIMGTPSQSGTFNFVVSVVDAVSDKAQQSFSLSISTAQVNCGPPNYCSRTDQKVVQVPGSVPNVGNLLGANTLVTDPDFSNQIVRITDFNTDPSLPEGNKSFVSAASGSADENLWNLNSTLFIVQSIGSWAYPFTFNPATMQASRMYVAANPSTNGLKLSDGGMWSRVDPNLLYTNSGTALFTYDFSSQNVTPSAQPFYDFTSSGKCLPSGFANTWQSRGGVSAGDTTFGMAFSNKGDQGTGTYVVAYRVGSGCTMLNTQTGQVTGDWGAQGTINIPDRWTIHNAKITKDGNWLVVVATNCTSSSCSTGPYFWQIGTTNVTYCGAGPHCGGHWTEGFTHWINNNDIMNQMMRPVSDVPAATELTPYLPGSFLSPLDQHQSWNNADPEDSLPLFATTWSTITPFPTAYYNEIVGYTPNGSGKIWRFAHNFITGQSQFFSTEYGIGSVSQDGRFFIFSSDWMGTLGSVSDTPSCTIGVDCRGDVFVVQLN